MISRTGAFTALLLSLLLAGLDYRVDSQRAGSSQTLMQLEQLPLQLAQWRGTELPGMGIRAKEVLQLDQHLQRAYRSATGAPVTLYLGYWEQQTGDHQAAKHSPKVCLPANGWEISESHSTVVPTNHGSIEVNELTAKRGTDSYLFLYWFFRGEQTYTQEWRALIDISLGAFMYGRSDGGIIEVSVPIRSADAAGARRTLLEFLSDFIPEFEKLNR
ncbi:MAG: EpsI family protein [Bdellovibrionales bacterium]|nr:EpsI family protein [Bdellovibrionales bacterium]